jgi:hypothetical protein
MLHSMQKTAAPLEEDTWPKRVNVIAVFRRYRTVLDSVTLEKFVDFPFSPRCGMTSCVRVGAALLAVLVIASFSVAQDADQKAATDATQQWLAMVDAGHYGQSWDAAASLFKSKVTKPDWEKALDKVRTPLGKVESREFKSADFETTLPGAPEGKYCVLQFRTKYKTGGMMIETVTPMLDDGQWKVSGYLIKPAEN